MKEEAQMEGSWRTTATSQRLSPALKVRSFNPSLQVTSKLAPELQRYIHTSMICETDAPI